MTPQGNSTHTRLPAARTVAWHAVSALLARLLAMLHRDEKERSSAWKAHVPDIWP